MGRVTYINFIILDQSLQKNIEKLTRVSMYYDKIKQAKIN